MRKALGFLWALVLFAIGFWGFQAFMFRSYESTREIRVRRDGARLNISSLWDGPYVVVGIVALGNSESDKRIATLPKPLLIVDSEGGFIDTSQLRWTDLRGEPAQEPAGALSAIVVLPKAVSESP